MNTQVAKKSSLLIGPAILISVGYIDPGNWATNIDGGTNFGFQLLWVLLLSNIMAILLQITAAKLGIVTGKSLAENCRTHYKKPIVVFLWATAEIAALATDLAEFLGAAIGIKMLTGMPLFYAALVTGVITFVILMVHKKGFQLLATIIFAMVMLVAIAYAIELFLAKPNVTNIAKGMFIPHLNSESLLVAIGIIGATVMPHNIFLHSDIVREHHEQNKKKALGYAIKNSVLSLNIAWFINSAMIIVAASVFFYQGIHVSSIEETYKTLEPTLGSLAGIMFAIALVSAGLSSSVTGTMAGQSILEGFLHISFPIWIRRLITMLPALIIIGMGIDTLKALVVSQVVLSMQLPFTILPLLLLTSKKDIMGNYQNNASMKIALWSIAILIIGLNVFLIGQTLH